MNKGLKKVLSYTLITTMVASMALTGFGGSARTVKADYTGAAYTDPTDSSSLVNFSTILGRAADFGITAATYHQRNHTETNMAVKKFIQNGEINDDPDLAGDEPLPFIVGDIEGILSIQKSYASSVMTLNIETTPEIINKSVAYNSQGGTGHAPTDKGYIALNLGQGAADATPDSNGYYNYGNFTTVFRSSSQTAINNNIDSMINNIVEKSGTLAGKTNSVDYIEFEYTNDTHTQKVDLNDYCIDLSDAKYDGKVVYINVPDYPANPEDASMLAKHFVYGNDKTLSIKKRSSTVVVFNVPYERVTINEMSVEVVDGPNAGTITSTTDQGPDVSERNNKVDAELCQKIILNLYNAGINNQSAPTEDTDPDVILNTVAGTVLVPNANSKTRVSGSSAGWIASAGRVENLNAEFHFIYKGRSTTLSSNENGTFHFAARKAIYSTTDSNGKPIERQDIPVSAGAFEFNLYETANDYNTTGKTPITTGSNTVSATNDKYSNIVFPDLSFDSSSLGTHYYVIKENNQGAIVNGITVNDGEIRIEVEVTSENGVIKFNIKKKHYLTSTSTTPFKSNDTADEVISNVYTLGGIYNFYDEGGALRINKTVSGDTAYAPQDTDFTVKVTGTKSDNSKLTGEFNASGLLNNETSVTFNSNGETTFTIRDGGSVTIYGLPTDAVMVVDETNIPSNFSLATASAFLTKTISSTETQIVSLDNEYTAPTGSIIFRKEFAFNPSTSALSDTEIASQLAALRFKVIDGNGNDVTAQFGLGAMTHSNGTLVWTKEISGLPIGNATYTVVEVPDPNESLSGFSAPTVTNNPSDVGVAAKESSFNTYTKTNTYTHLETVTVQKAVTGATLPNGFKITNSYNNTEFTVDNANSGGTGTTANPYTWTIANVPSGTNITFTESGYDRTGYTETVYNNTTNTTSQYEVAGGAQTVTVSSTAANLCTFYNVYTRTNINLNIEKVWVVNPNGTDIPDSLTLTLKGSTSSNANYSSQDVVLSKSDYASNATTWTKQVSVPECDEDGNTITYTWYENDVPTGYALTGNVVSNNTTTITNTTPVPAFGSLKINKVVSGNDARATSDYIVTVQGDDGNYYNANGVIVAVNNANITVVGGGNVTINNLPVQKYTITESRTLAEVSNYTLDIQYTGLTEGKVQVSKDATSEVTITNTYTECGSVEIEKVASGDPFPANAPSFPISISFDTDGTYTVAEYPFGGAQHAATVDFTANTAVTYNLHAGDKIIISGVPAGVEYTVSEGDISALTDYAKDGISGDVDTNGKGTIASGVKKEVDVTNSYTAPVIQTGSIKVTKVQANGSDPIPAAAAFPITVTFNDTSDVTYQVSVNGGTAQNVSFAAADTHAVTQNIKVGDFFEISGVPQGVTYTVTEDLTGLTDYVTPNITSGSGSISGTQVDATVANSYTAQATTPTNITVNFSKRETGKTEELPGATLQLLNGTTSVSQFQSGTSPVSINNLGAGTYTLKELVPPTDYQTAADITFTIEDDGTNTGTLIVKDANGVEIQDKTIVMFDAKVPMKEVSFSKVSIGNIGKIAGAKLTLYSVGANGVLTKKIDWTSSETDVYKFTLAAGDYAIEETVAPEGYVKATSLVKFNLSFDTNGNAVIKVTEGPGTYDATNDVILIKNDPIQVTGKLSVHVEEKKTGRPVPDAEVEVTGPDGTTKTYKTNGDGEIVDPNGNTPIDVPAGTYKIKIKSVPKGYDVDTGEVGDVTVPENGEGRHIAKIVSSTGGLKIKVLEEGTKREVPDATVVVEAPEGVKFPDGSTKITAVTDKNGNITTYTGADGKTYDLTSGLTPGDYKITVTKVPAGYNVTVGETKTCKVVKDEVAEHIALIATSSSVQPAPAPAPAPAATPASTPATPTGSITNSINVKTGDDMNVYPALIAMALSLITGVAVVAFRRKRETK